MSESRLWWCGLTYQGAREAGHSRLKSIKAAIKAYTMADDLQRDANPAEFIRCVKHNND